MTYGAALAVATTWAVLSLLPYEASGATLVHEVDFTPSGAVDILTNRGPCGELTPASADRLTTAGPVYLPQFDPALGDLMSVSMRLDYYLSVSGSQSHCYSGDRNISVVLLSNLTLEPNPVLAALQVGEYFATDWAAISSAESVSAAIQGPLSDSFSRDSNIPQAWIGDGLVGPFSATGRERVGGSIAGGGQYQLVGYAFATTATLRVIYEYEPAIPACANGLDDDGDGLADLADGGCSSGTDLDERNPLIACDDGADNDSDGGTDFPEDPGCFDGLGTTESPQCQDGLDNDSADGIDFDGGASLDLDEDGFVDASFNPATPAVGDADPQCIGYPAKNREAPKACGLGGEIALMLPALLLLRRRRAVRT